MWQKNGEGRPRRKGGGMPWGARLMLKVVMLGPYPADERFTRGGVEKVTYSTV